MGQYQPFDITCKQEYEKRMQRMEGILPSTLCFESIIGWGDICKASYQVIEDYVCIKIVDNIRRKSYFYMVLCGLALAQFLPVQHGC